MKVSHNQLKKLINKSFSADKPLMILGSMGLGKSQVVKESAENYAKRLNKKFMDWNYLSDEMKHKAVEVADLSGSMFFVDIRLSQKDPSDLTGIPFVKNDHMKWFPPMAIKLLSNPTCNAVVFFDELSDASVPVMKSAYQLVLDRCSGEVAFSEHVRIIAAGNRSVDKCGVNDTPKALDNRFMNVELDPPSPEEWSKWAMAHNVDNRLISFINMSPAHLCQDVKTITGKSFPTPRSVAMLSDVTKDETDIDIIEMCAAACCGDGFSTDYVAYLENAKDVDPVKLCNNPSLFNNLSLGAKWFSLSALASYYKDQGSKIVDKLVEVMDQQDPDMAFVQFFMNREMNKLFPTQMQKSQGGTDLYNKFSKYILSED